MSQTLTRVRVETGFWLILLLVLASGVGMETDWGRQLQSPATEIAVTSSEFKMPALVESFQLRGPDEFPNMTTRPLFIVTRRPAAATPASEMPGLGMQKGQFVLTGTILVAEGKFALLIEKAGNRSRVVAEGNQVNGITVKEVTKERVILSQDDDTEELVLKVNTPPGKASVGGGVPARPLGVIVPGGMPRGGAAPAVPPTGR